MATITAAAVLVVDLSLADPVTASSQYEPVRATLDMRDIKKYRAAPAASILAGDGAGIDPVFRNSGVVVDEVDGSYYAVNGVHAVRRGDYTSYYPKSIIKASLESDEIIRSYSFGRVRGHDIDMEALTFGGNLEKLYIGDEYNYIYELDLASGDLTSEWNLADIGQSNRVDAGIEALGYSGVDGFFYAGIQQDQRIIVVDLDREDGRSIRKVREFDLPTGWPPSGIFVHADGTLYIVAKLRGDGPDSRKVFRYTAEGSMICELTMPRELGITRPDGIFIDAADEYLYIADSQGPLHDGYSLYRLAWNNPCAGQR